MNRSLRCFIFLASLVFSSPVMASSSAVAANVAQVARAFNAAIAWQTESMVLRERKLIEGEREDIQAMLAAGVYSKQHAEELLEEKEADYQRALDSLRWSNGFNAVMGAVEEQTLPYNSKHEKMASWGGAVTGLGAISEENIGKWRKTRLVLLLAELLLGFVQSRIGVAAVAEQAPSNKRILSVAALRRIIRLLHNYLLAGNGDARTKLSYLLQAASIGTAFFGPNRQAAARGELFARIRRARAGDGGGGVAGPVYDPPLTGSIIPLDEIMPHAMKADIDDPVLKARVECRMHRSNLPLQKEAIFNAAYGEYVDPVVDGISYQDVLPARAAKTLYEAVYGVKLPDEKPAVTPADPEPDADGDRDGLLPCSICLVNSPNVAVGGRADEVTECCGHAFCYGCLAGHIAGDQASRGCPMCRRPVNIVFPVEGNHSGEMGDE